MQCWEWFAMGHTKHLSYNQLRLAWLSFIKLLNYGQSQDDGFVCPECSIGPEVLICDGITLSMQKRYLTTCHEKNIKEEVLSGSL